MASEPGEVAGMVDVEADAASELDTDRKPEIACEVTVPLEAVFVA